MVPREIQDAGMAKAIQVINLKQESKILRDPDAEGHFMWRQLTPIFSYIDN